MSKYLEEYSEKRLERRVETESQVMIKIMIIIMMIMIMSGGRGLSLVQELRPPPRSPALDPGLPGRALSGGDTDVQAPGDNFFFRDRDLTQIPWLMLKKII